MKNLIKSFLIVAPAALIACNNSPKKATNPESTKTEDSVEKPSKPEIHKEYYGTYFGKFDNYKYQGENYSPMSINITSITEDGVIGTDNVKGVTRPLEGTLTEKNGITTFNLQEPGDKNTDGKFSLTFAKDSLKGTWTPNVKGKLTKNEVNLEKRAFTYDPDLKLPSGEEEEGDVGYYVDYQNPQKQPNTSPDEYGEDDYKYRMASKAIFELNASTQKLTESELKNLKKIDLEIIKNTIYAKHGYAFKNPSIRQFYNYVPWYSPLYDDVEAKLTPLEKQNVVLLQRFIKYATDTYDYYGR